MSKKEIKIIITEKASMAHNMYKHLWCNIKKQGYYTNKDESIYIARAVWHLLELKTPSDIDQKYKLWSLKNLPIFVPFADKYIPSQNWKSQLLKILNIFNKNKDNDIIIYHCWDPDREWELIVRNIVRYIKEELNKKNIDIEKSIKHEYRLWLKDFSKQTIFNEIKKKNDIKNFNDFYFASMARQHSDWLIWMNMTPYYTVVSGSYGQVLNVWRVQSSILRIVVDKELEILNFKEITKFKIIWEFNKENPFQASWYSEKLKDWKLDNKNLVKKVLDDLKEKKEFKIIEKKQEIKKETLKELYNLPNIQADAEKKYWYSLNETLEIMQSLYENHTIMSYPRANDSWYIAEDDYEKLEQGFLEGLLKIEKYKDIIQSFINEKKLKPTKNYVDNEKVWAHSWIYIKLPDDESKNFIDVYNQLNKNEKNILDLIVCRILWVLEGDYIYESSELVLNNWPHFFKLNWKILKNLWFKKYYNISNKKWNVDKLLPKLDKWDSVILEKTEVKEVKNKKPQRYTQGSLWLSINDLALLLKDDPKLSARIRKLSPKNNKWDRALWLWTWWTRWNIINWLIKDGFIKEEWKGKKIIPTSKWFKLISILDNKFKDPITTWIWEDLLKQIEDWEYTYKEFIDNTKKDITTVINQKEIKADKKYKYEPILDDAIWICPSCWVWEIKVWEKGYSCSSKKCDFIIWKNFLNHTFSAKEVEILLKWESLKNIKLYSTKKEKEFTTNLKVNFKSWKIEFVK